MAVAVVVWARGGVKGVMVMVIVRAVSVAAAAAPLIVAMKRVAVCTR